jgi:hypothetical protein
MQTNKERWYELCAQAANEQDGKKLREMVAEINRLLDEKCNRLAKARQTSKPIDPKTGK